jgi:hypothetical protein
MKLRTSTPDLIARAFAEAVEAGDHEAAEGWLTLAAYSEDRRPSRRRHGTGTGRGVLWPRRQHEPVA